MNQGWTSIFRRAPVLWAFLSYLGLTLILTAPLVRQIGSALPSDNGDPVLNTWILWWSTQAIPLSDQWWSPPAFFPISNTFAFSEHLLGLLPLFGPTYWLSGNAALGYNVAFVLSFPLSGLSAYLLSRELTGRDDASWVAGLIYGFAPYRIDHLSHLQVLSWYWLPLVLLGLHRYVRDGRTRWLVLFGLAYLLQGLSNGYMFLFVPVLVGMWVIWFVPLIRRWRVAASIALAGAIAVVIALPVLLKYRVVHRQFGFERSLGEINFFSGDLTAILSAPRHLAVWGWMDGFYGPEGQLFPGLTIVCLLALAVVRLRWPGPEASPRWVRLPRALCAMLSALFFLVIVWRLVIGPVNLDAFGLKLSVNHLVKPFTFAMLFLSTLGLLSPVVLAARARRSLLGFYLLAIVAMWILTWGPFPTVLEQRVFVAAPYNWLLSVIPGFDGLRVPARFWILGTVCLSAAGGLVLAHAVAVGSRFRPVVVALVGLGVIADGWVAEFPVVAVPRLSASLSGNGAGAILELPLGFPYDDLDAMYRSTHHGRPVVNGYSGQRPPYYPALRWGLAHRDGEVLQLLAQLGVAEVLVNRDRDTNGLSAEFLSSYEGAQQIRETPEEIVYRLSADTENELKKEIGSPIPIIGLLASVNGDSVGNAIDGDQKSRWGTGPQKRGHELVIDLGTRQSIGGVGLSLGSFVHDFPRSLQVSISDDGVEWKQVWRGPTAAMTIVAALRDPLKVELNLPCPTCQGRFVRLRQLGRDPVYYWSVTELSVLAAVPVNENLKPASRAASLAERTVWGQTIVDRLRL